MPLMEKSAADQVAEAKAKAAGIPYVKRTWDNLPSSNVGHAENSPNKPKAPESDAQNIKTNPTNREPSPAQIAANKANGLLSTGPRTPEGKAKASTNDPERTGQAEATPKVSSVVRDQETPGLRSERNPLSEGPRSELRFAKQDARAISTTIPGEQTQFESTLVGFSARFQPNDEVELHLVQRLAQLTLRLNRAVQMETALTDQAHASATDWIDNHPDHFPDPAQHPTKSWPAPGPAPLRKQSC